MKNYQIIIVALCLNTFFLSCKKSSSTSNHAQAVTWRVDAGAVQSATDISFLRLLGANTIYASKDTNSIFLSTDATSVGTYSNSNATASVGIRISSTGYNNISSSVTITSNNNSKLTGYFSAVFIDTVTGNFTLLGTFTDINYY